MTLILDGSKLQELKKKALAAKIARLSKKRGQKITLAIVQVGDLDESNVYIKYKKMFAEKIGVAVLHKKFEAKISEGELVREVARLSKSTSVHGIIVQLPLPRHINENLVIEAISPKKDVDGLTGLNTKLLMDNKTRPGTGVVPATTRGILDLLDYYGVDYRDKKVLMIGSSVLVGIPTALAFLNRGANVAIANDRTKNLAEATLAADIIIVAAGQKDLITGKMVRRGQVIVDVGINVVGKNSPNSKRKVVGDVDFAPVSKIVAAITPVPGGVGPMTVISIFENLVESVTSILKK